MLEEYSHTYVAHVANNTLFVLKSKVAGTAIKKIYTPFGG